VKGQSLKNTGARTVAAHKQTDEVRN
jgi:hypothetical protein